MARSVKDLWPHSTAPLETLREAAMMTMSVWDANMPADMGVACAHRHAQPYEPLFAALRDFNSKSKQDPSYVAEPNIPQETLRRFKLIENNTLDPDEPIWSFIHPNTLAYILFHPTRHPYSNAFLTAAVFHKQPKMFARIFTETLLPRYIAIYATNPIPHALLRNIVPFVVTVGFLITGYGSNRFKWPTESLCIFRRLMTSIIDSELVSHQMPKLHAALTYPDCTWELRPPVDPFIQYIHGRDPQTQICHVIFAIFECDDVRNEDLYWRTKRASLAEPTSKLDPHSRMAIPCYLTGNRFNCAFHKNPEHNLHSLLTHLRTPK